jgi:hypothetical protein
MEKALIRLATSTCDRAGPDENCRALEQSAAHNALPVEFFARVIWQESRFNASKFKNPCVRTMSESTW